jgi:hypothetical protein
MRTVYHEKLSELSEQLGRMCGLAGAAMERATRALMQADLTSAEQVITDQDQIMAMTTKAEQNGIALLALQQPVAGELRTIVSSIQAVADVERMGALAMHVAKIARRRHPQHVLPEEVNGCFAEMGRVAVELGIAHRKCCERAIQKRRLAFANKTTRWMICTGSCSPCLWIASGSTGSPPLSMWRCSAAFTSASPTTPSRSAGGLSSRRPAHYPLNKKWGLTRQPVPGHRNKKPRPRDHAPAGKGT